ncbi:MAG: deaminase [Patescibacteria group bacterium]
MPLTSADQKFLKLLKKIAPKSTCLRAKIAAIAVRNGKVLETGDNSFHKCYDCNVIGCIRDIQQIPSGTRREICYGICAEQRLFTRAVQKGIKLAGATLYVTSHPCRVCEGLIAESGIKRVVYIKGFPDVIPIYDTLKDFGLEVIQAPEHDDKPHEASTI